MSFFIRLLVLFALLFGTTVFASVGKVSLLKGEATLQRQAQKTPLKNGTVLEEKDIIATAKDAQIQLVFEDKTVITLGSESELKIEEYLNDAAKPKAKFKFGEGSFKSITGQIGKTAPENFTLETKTATIGIRGTTIQGNIGRGGDRIACISGTIVVREIGSPNFVVVPAGKSTFVAPGTPPTPPQSITPQNGGTPPANGNTPPPAPPIQDLSSITDKSNNDALLQKVQETNVPQRISNTDFYVFGPFGIPNLESSTYVYENYGEGGEWTTADVTVINASETLRYDTRGEINVAKITGSYDYADIRYNDFELIYFQGVPSVVSYDGEENPILPALLYYKDSGGLYSNPSLVTNNTNLDRTAVIVNTTNRKILSTWIDNYGVGIGIGSLSLDSQMNVSMTHYKTEYSDSTANNNMGLWSPQEMSGKIYGTDYQAIAMFVNPDDTATVNDIDFAESHPSEAAIAFRNISTSYTTPINRYSDTEVLTGMTTSQLRSDGSGVTTNDLAITLDKISGTLHVSSDTFNIPDTISAYIHDDYFSALTTTGEEPILMQDYLIAISYDSDKDDYVSWGYWGQTSNTETPTTPFSTWVAGVQTPSGAITALASLGNAAPTYQYSGHVIGSVIEGTTIGYILNDTHNAINLNVNFGTSTIGGNIAFKTNLNSTWNSTVTAATLTPATSSFAATLSGGNASGALSGNFYGPAANSVAGGFNLTKGSTSNAVGSFKATALTVPTVPAY